MTNEQTVHAPVTDNVEVFNRTEALLSQYVDTDLEASLLTDAQEWVQDINLAISAENDRIVYENGRYVIVAEPDLWGLLRSEWDDGRHSEYTLDQIVDVVQDAHHKQLRRDVGGDEAAKILSAAYAAVVFTED